MILTDDVKFIISRLEAFGYRADVVGGPVRDYLLGKIPDDYDITTAATPEETKAVFSDFKTVDTGIKHGTVTLILNGSPYEITTYRIDGEYKDARHPESVYFTTLIEEDLSRRDFTMNAIAYNPKDGITDPFGGERDINSGIIRTVGEPEKRFTEDALRILRGVRFAARLGFEIEEATAAAMHKHKELLGMVSVERIYTEWHKLLSGDFATGVLSEFSDVIRVFLPEIADAEISVLRDFSEYDYMTRLISLFYISGKSSEEYRRAMKRLKTDSRTVELGAAALDSVGVYDTFSEVGIGRLLNSVGEDAAGLTVSVERLVLNKGADTKALLEKYIAENRPYKISHLRINGNDLLGMGAVGRDIGSVLQRLLTEVIDGTLINGREELAIRACEIIKEVAATL